MIFLLALLPLIGGLYLVLPAEQAVVNDIGSGLIGGSLIGLIFAVVQFTMDRRSQQQDKDLDLRLILTSTLDLTGIDLSNRSLTRVYLRGRNLTAARLDYADLTAVNLRNSTLDSAVLTGAKLTGARLSEAHAEAADFTGCQLKRADLSDAQLMGAVLQEARLDSAKLIRANLAGADLSRSWITGADLADADLTGAQLTGAQARGVRMPRAQLGASMLVLGDFNGAHLSRASLKGADLTGANLSQAILVLADLTGAVLRGCSLAGADLSGARLKGAVLAGVDLTGAVLIGCDLRGADLRQAQLSGVVLSKETSLSDASTQWPADMPAGTSSSGRSAAAPRAATGWRAAAGCRRLVVTAAEPAAQPAVKALIDELAGQRELGLVQRQGSRVSLPLGARTARVLAATSRRNRLRERLPHRLGGTVRLRITVPDAAGSRTLRAVLSRGRERIDLPVVDLGPRLPVAGQAEPPSATEELAARVLNLLDPRDGAPWLARAHVTRAMRRWDEHGVTATADCRRELLAAAAVDPLGPAVNYALGALAYNEYDEESTRRSIEFFGIAHASAGRLPAEMAGLAGLSLSGVALAHCQLYHRFSEQTPEVLAAARSAAMMAVATTRQRLKRRHGSARLRRNAMEGYALARYGEAFSRHITELPADVEASIPLYQDAIETLERADLPVPAVLFNNLGYQYMTLAGRVEPGPDLASYQTARKLFEQARQRSPELHFAWANLGNVHRLLGEHGAAENCYREALRLCKLKGIKYPPGWNELACVLLQFNRRDEAERCHREACAATSSVQVRADLRAEYSASLLLIGQPGLAVATAERGLAEDPDNQSCQRALAEAQARI